MRALKIERPAPPYWTYWAGHRASWPANPRDGIDAGSGLVYHAELRRAYGHNVVYLRILLDSGYVTALPAHGCDRDNDARPPSLAAGSGPPW